ncbi:MAG: hypothetical protein H0X52_02045 [Gemmatimonadetes bacterium]|jgi:hypothetical protein|nr:hypothetical protein [Gemmatimonadota bacterium]
MVRSGSHKAVDRSQAEKYRRVGVSLLASARALESIAVTGDPYGNAIGVVAVHAAIAYNDALTVAFRGIKSTEGDHRKAADVLQQALGHRAAAEQVNGLRSILALKDRISYAGQYYTLHEAQQLLRSAETFAEWAEALYLERPPA